VVLYTISSLISRLKECNNSFVVINLSFFDRLPQLEEVTSDKNELTEIVEDTFSSNPKLKKISLSHNRINSLSKKAFHNLHNLRELWLLFNELEVV